MARLEVPKALCVPGGLPAVCVVRGTQERRVSFEEIEFKDVVGAAPVLGLVAVMPLGVLLVDRERVLPVVPIFIVAACVLFVFVTLSMRMRPRVSCTLPFESSAFELWSRRRRAAGRLVRGLTLFSFFSLGVTVVLFPRLGGQFPLVLVPSYVLFALIVPLCEAHRWFLVRPLGPRVEGPRGRTLTLVIPSEVAAAAIRDYLDGRIALKPAPPGARCASHEGQASFVCARCGDFACTTCAPAERALAPLCGSCRQQLQGSDGVRGRDG